MTDGPSETAFDAFGLPDPLRSAIREMGFVRPTPIQEKAIPPALAGRDLIGCAPTGSGKTVAYLLPILARMMASRARDAKGPPRTCALVLAPTRELALQVESVAQVLGRAVGFRSVAVFGGVGMEPQTKGLRSGVEVVAATPGRLLDHLEIGNARLDRLAHLVLDEADRMLDIGFMPDILRIIQRLPKERQTLLFSATMPDAIVRIARSIQRDAEEVSVGEIVRRPKIPAGITHAIYPIPSHRKTALLLKLIGDLGMESTLVFARTRERADLVAAELRRAGLSVACLHSDYAQAERIAALESFRARRVQILVATDIAARGLDIDDISHVVNYDLPQTAEDYVHRVGRTGRADATGDAVSLVSVEEMHGVAPIEEEVGKPIPRLTYPGFSATGDARTAAAPVVLSPVRAQARRGGGGRRGLIRRTR